MSKTAVAAKPARSYTGRRAGGGVPSGRGIKLDRFYSKNGVYDNLPGGWERKDVEIVDDKGARIFVQTGVEFPTGFSAVARKITASRYLYGERGTPQRENSLKTVIDRITDTAANWGSVKKDWDAAPYFETQPQAQLFRDELARMILEQNYAPNSPVWFNVGLHRYQMGAPTKGRKTGFVVDKGRRIVPLPEGTEYLYPQTAACFIQSVEDTMEGIMQLAVNEAMLFKYGSGTGTNLSSLRSSKEKLSGGGKPSGPLAYLKFYDRVAGIVKSGGKTRRAAKMDILDVSHPDIKEFITAKRDERLKAKAMIKSGVDPNEAFDTIAYQNANLSVRVTDEFMKLVESNGEWRTVPVHSKDMADKMPVHRAGDLMDLMAQCAADSAEPGIQYHDTANKWHTCPNSGSINASNPCSEYFFLDDSACNLGSFRLTKFLTPEGGFDVAKFKAAVRRATILQDIVIDNSSYPTEKIANNAHRFRPLGIGYADLGALLMNLGLPYDSDEARATAAAITSVMTATVYETSAEIAGRLGAFAEFEKNREPMLKVMGMHREAARNIDRRKLPTALEQLLEAGNKTWDRVVELGAKNGFRNAQATVLAPTGTIGIYMDCDTNGVEPDFSLVKVKATSEGGLIRIINTALEPSLKKLGYASEQRRDMITYIMGNEDKPEGAPHLSSDDAKALAKLFFNKREDVLTNSRVKFGEDEKELEKLKEKLLRKYTPEERRDALIYFNGHGTIEGAPHIKEEHLAIYDCANKVGDGKRFIDPMGHIKMMAAVQPLLSGAISKTVNLPRTATWKDVKRMYMEGWKMGVKSIAVYIDGSSDIQPLSSFGGAGGFGKLEKIAVNGGRTKLPQTRFTIGSKLGILDGSGNGGGETEIYLQGGFGDDGRLREAFLTAGKEGNTVGGLLGAFATALSLDLQYAKDDREALRVLNKFRHANFSPSGRIKNVPKEDLGVLDELFGHPAGQASSPVDLIVAKLERYVEGKKYIVAAMNTFRELAAEKRKAEGAGNAESPISVVEVVSEGEEKIDLSEEVEHIICPNCKGHAEKRPGCKIVCLGACKKSQDGGCGG